jgi:hypothetical protein
LWRPTHEKARKGHIGQFLENTATPSKPASRITSLRPSRRLPAGASPPARLFLGCQQRRSFRTKAFPREISRATPARPTARCGSPSAPSSRHQARPCSRSGSLSGSGGRSRRRWRCSHRRMSLTRGQVARCHSGRQFLRPSRLCLPRYPGPRLCRPTIGSDMWWAKKWVRSTS